MNHKFESLVRSLDPETLEQLRRQVTSEIEGRRQQTAIRIENIHPHMSAAEKEQAAQEIARVLREQV